MSSQKKENHLEEICTRFLIGNSSNVGADDYPGSGKQRQERQIGCFQRFDNYIKEASQEVEEERHGDEQQQCHNARSRAGKVTVTSRFT